MYLEQPSDFPLHIIVTFSNPPSGSGGARGGNGGDQSPHFFRKMVSEIHANPMRKWGEGVGLHPVNCVDVLALTA